MFKVLKNLKKSWISVVAIVILLCVQAWADLELPSYTSKIVDTGIVTRKYRVHIKHRITNAWNSSNKHVISSMYNVIIIKSSGKLRKNS